MQPRIAVAALNPHGGEGGLLGREEIDELMPAIANAKEAGINATGPLSADSVFNRAIAGEFDVVLALYHDQGHIAIKVHNFHESITATLGIPIVRTSVDHGTAFDIAGKGVADATGMFAAMEPLAPLSPRTLGKLGTLATTTVLVPVYQRGLIIAMLKRPPVKHPPSGAVFFYPAKDECHMTHRIFSCPSRYGTLKRKFR